MARQSKSLPKPRSKTSSTRTLYIHSLPTEILQYIIASIDDSPRTKESQKTLLSLSLTSTLFRDLSQPFLLRNICTSIGAGQELFKLLLKKTPDESLRNVRSINFDDPFTKVDSRMIKLFVNKATNLKSVTIRKDVAVLQAFFGTNIKTLSLYEINLDLRGHVFNFPELVDLCIAGRSRETNIQKPIRHSLPKLRHLAMSGGDFYWTPNERTLMDELASTLVSFTTTRPKPPPISITSNTSASKLVQYAVTDCRFSPDLHDIRHLYLSIENKSTKLRAQERRVGFTAIREWTAQILETEHRLESVTLAVRGGGGKGNVPEDWQRPLKALVTVCREQNIELSWEAEVGFYSFETRVPLNFIRRAERNCVKRKGGNE